jgi:hypothetical protein
MRTGTELVEPNRPGIDTGEDAAADLRHRIAHWFLFAVLAGLAWRVLRFALHFEVTGDEAGILRSVME